MVKVAIYLRRSRLKDGMNEKETLENHLNLLTNLAKKKNYDYDIYNDGISSSMNNEREDYKRMIQEIEKGKYERILVTEESRLTRDTVEALQLYRILAKHKMLIETLNGIFNPADRSQELTGVIKAIINEQEYEQNKLRFANGRITSVRDKGKHMGALPFGYQKDKNTGTVSIIEGEAKIIRKAHELYQEGLSVYRITQYFSDIGIRNKEGKAFTDTTIYKFLTNKAYVGIYTFNSAILNEVVVVRDSYPQIIDAATFEKTQARIEENKKKNRKFHQPAKTALSKLIYCGKCYGALQIHEKKITTKSNEAKIYYSVGTCRRLIGDEKNKICGNTGLSLNKLLPAVYADLKNYKQELQKSLEEVEQHDFNKELDRLKERKEELEKKLNSFGDQKGIIMELVKKQIIPISEYEQERKKIEQETEHTQLELESVSLQIENFKIEDIKSHMKYVIETIDHVPSFSQVEQNNFFKSIINKILLNDTEGKSKVEILYY